MQHVLPRAYISDILGEIPHRYPFLLIDRMEACEPGKWVRATKNVSAGDWFFQGTAPSRRVMPQLLLLEALAQAAGILCHFSGLMDNSKKTIVLFATANDTHFYSDARPGEQLAFECHLTRALRGVAKLTGKCCSGERTIMQSTLSAAIRTLD